MRDILTMHAAHNTATCHGITVPKVKETAEMLDWFKVSQMEVNNDKFHLSSSIVFCGNKTVSVVNM